ncbi:MAG: hypothetical protein A3F13_04545 [Gammaproteobacteria bacterium RIFCSPHIGHO2_12_FULL_40_19]|nr:MAG: hypothetical protein A3F13_04545 [Gammaproteobacteria bacterium RIFCSPHIGHO2_12_FULL_40_19]
MPFVVLLENVGAPRTESNVTEVSPPFAGRFVVDKEVCGKPALVICPKLQLLVVVQVQLALVVMP